MIWCVDRRSVSCPEHGRVSLALPGFVAAAVLLSVTLCACGAASLPDESRPATDAGPDPTTEDRPREPVTVGVSVGSATAVEGEAVLFPVTVSAPVRTPLTVRWRTADGTASAHADYTPVTDGAASFAVGGAQRQTIRVATLPDEEDEDDETFLVTLTDAIPAAEASLDRTPAVGTITDDDDSPAVPTAEPPVDPPGGPPASPPSRPPPARPPADDHGDTPATATSLTPGVTTGRLETAADMDYFKIAVSADSRLVAATDPGKVADGGYPRYASATVVTIHTATHIVTNPYLASMVVSAGDAYVRVLGSAATWYDLAVWVLEPTETDTSFDIELRYVGTEPTAAQKKEIRAAADVWEDVITGDLARTVLYDSRFKCMASDPSDFGKFVDDLRVDVRLRSIDGNRGTLGVAGPCLSREDGLLPAAGDVTFDTADLSRLSGAGLRHLALHEIAHVLGFGTSDPWTGLLRDSALRVGGGSPGTTLPDTHFTGSAAVSAFDEALGSATYSGKKVPVENDRNRFSEGGVDGHWRLSVFGDELMVPTFALAAPLSKVTIAALADLGYRVDYTKAAAYTVPSSSLTSATAASGLARPNALHVGDDIRRGPVFKVETPDQRSSVNPARRLPVRPSGSPADSE